KTWKRGRAILRARLEERTMPLPELFSLLEREAPHRIPGTAVFMVGTPDTTPPALVHNLRYNKVLHDQVIFLSVITEEEPYVPRAERAAVLFLPPGFWSIKLRYGFMENPHVPRALQRLEMPELAIVPEQTTYFLGHESILSTAK